MTTSVIPAAALSSPGTGRAAPVGTIEERVAEPPIVDGRAPAAHSACVRADEPLEAVQLPHALGATKYPYTKRLLTSLPVPNLAERAMRRGELRMLRVEDRP